MFGLKKSSNPEETLPNPPSTEDILEDLNKAGPDDVVFTTNIADLSANLDQTSRNFQLQKRFQVINSPQCLKITEKVAFNIASEASYVYILSVQKFIKNAKNGQFWRVFEYLQLAVKQCYQTGQF